MRRIGSALALVALVASNLACGKALVDSLPDAAAVDGGSLPLVEGRGITMSVVWAWSPRATGAERSVGFHSVEAFVTLTGAGGYLRTPAKSVRLVTASGARFPVADPMHAACTDVVALGETRSCSFLFLVPIAERPERLELRVAPEPAVVVELANPPPTSGPCVVSAPCTPCAFPASGFECQTEARARGLEPTCSFEDEGPLPRRTTLYCPPGYRTGR